MNKLIQVEVVYGLPDHQELIALQVEQGTTILEVIEISNITEHFPEIVPSEAKVGIFSRAAKLDQVIKAGERVEIYRPLIADPKELRRIRAERAKLAGRADKITGGRPKKKTAEAD